MKILLIFASILHFKINILYGLKDNVKIITSGNTTIFSGSIPYAELNVSDIGNVANDQDLKFFNVTIKEAIHIEDCNSITLVNVLLFINPKTFIGTKALTLYNSTLNGNGTNLNRANGVIVVLNNVNISQSTFANLYNFSVFMQIYHTNIYIDNSKFINNKNFSNIFAGSATKVAISHSEFQNNNDYDTVLDGKHVRSLKIENCSFLNNRKFESFIKSMNYNSIGKVIEVYSNTMKYNFGKKLFKFSSRVCFIAFSNNIYFMNAVRSKITQIEISSKIIESEIQIFNEEFNNNFAKCYYEVKAPKNTVNMTVTECTFEINHPINSCDVVKANDNAFVILDIANSTFRTFNESYLWNKSDCHFAYVPVLRLKNEPCLSRSFDYKKIFIIFVSTYLFGVITMVLFICNMKILKGDFKIEKIDAEAQILIPSVEIRENDEVHENYYAVPFEDVRQKNIIN